MGHEVHPGALRVEPSVAAVTDQGRCPRHPRHPVDSCPPCERLIELAEQNRDHPGPDDDGWQSAQNQYERYLDRMGGSA